MFPSTCVPHHVEGAVHVGFNARIDNDGDIDIGVEGLDAARRRPRLLQIVGSCPLVRPVPEKKQSLSS